MRVIILLNTEWISESGSDDPTGLLSGSGKSSEWPRVSGSHEMV